MQLGTLRIGAGAFIHRFPLSQNSCRLQQRAQWPALGRALLTLLHYALSHEPAVQIRPDQPDYSSIINALL